ncbi:MAG: hypothetical protein ACERLG_01385 [Sedimentibacter sp.]
MKIHYFQRYHGAENVATNNALLLISRLYNYSPDLFHRFMAKLVEEKYTDFYTEVNFELQLKGQGSVPDGQIQQKGYNIIIETKKVKKFIIFQIQNHLSEFKNEDFQIMLTLSPYEMDLKQADAIKNLVDKENSKRNINIKHIHTTFQKIISYIDELVDDYRDYEIRDILEDYRECCSLDNLLPNSGRLMRAVTAGETYDDNIELNLYYDPADRGYTEHTYIGLYKNKAIRAVGKIVAIVEADLINEKLIIKGFANITTKQEKDILEAIKRGINHGYNIETDHKFFLVDKFYNTNYEKTSKQSLRGKKFFDICELFPKESITGAEMLALRLNDMTWQ